MPSGVDVTVPEPEPVFETFTVCFGRLNVAVTATTLSTVTVQGAVPLHAPPHPPNVEGASGVAVSVTEVPAG